MTDTVLHAAIGGIVYPLSRCSWVRYGPNGCAYGFVDAGDVPTELEAHRAFEPSKVERAREVREGWKHVLVPNAQMGPVYVCVRRKCGHAPLAPVKGICRVCGRELRLTKNGGGIWNHGTKVKFGEVGYLMNCRGSGLAPKDPKDKEGSR